MKNWKFLLIVPFLINLVHLQSQELLPENWHLLDAKENGLPGISVEKAYKELLSNRKSKPIIVAILDSGVDYKHEDLQEVMWVNPKEIAGNGIDDDHNGYIDDIHGWNFIGGPKGNISVDSYEGTRLYAQMRYKYEKADPDKLNKEQKKEYDLFLKLKNDIESKRKSAQLNYDNIVQTESLINGALDALETALHGKPLNAENLASIEEGDSKALSMGIAIAKQLIQEKVPFTNIAEIKSLISKDFIEGKEHFEKEIKYAYNPDFDPRSIVGDRYEDIKERYYGNNDVKGPDAMHGTHVAGIVAAVRNNDKGIDGIADNVKIMSVRCVPDGDERDKDIANAIRYAVDNGASVINMSFGKGYSPNKEVIDEAVRYAMEKDVLLVHAAGNAGSDNDEVDNFPNKKYKEKKFLSCNKASNWVEVGASSYEAGPELIAGFSNYGKKGVDLFAPGVQIYSTTPENHYEPQQGTSMASPVVAGVAALLRSYFPDLTAKQVREILLKSTEKQNYKVITPGTKKEAKLSEISSTGGLVNAYSAIQLAQKTKGKKKGQTRMGEDEKVKSDNKPKA